jgi:hypothetical protein
MSGGAFFERIVGGCRKAADEFMLLVGEFVEGAKVRGVAARAGVLRLEVGGVGVHVWVSAVVGSC